MRIVIKQLKLDVKTVRCMSKLIPEYEKAKTVNWRTESILKMAQKVWICFDMATFSKRQLRCVETEY